MTLGNFAMIISLFLCVSLCALCNAQMIEGYKDKFFLIVDAGSSGSRLHVFKYNYGAEPPLQGVAVFKTEPGLSSYASQISPVDPSRPTGAWRSIKSLLDQGKDVIPSAYWKDTPLSIVATAGMRLISEDDQRNIFNAIKHGFDDGHYPFQFDASDMMILPGQYEAFLSWLSVNYLTGKLELSYGSLPADDSIGSLDLGGGSTQIVYDTKKVLKEFTLPSSSTLYIRSWLGGGVNQVRKAIESKIVLNSIESLEKGSHRAIAINPCAHFGYQTTQSVGVKEDKHLRSEDVDGNSISVALVGSGDTKECTNMINEALDSIGLKASVLPTVPSQDFVGMSNYFYFSDFLSSVLPDHPSLKKASLKTLNTALSQYCEAEWETASKYAFDSGKPVHKHTNSLERAESRCLEGLVAISILKRFGIPDESSQVQLLQDIDGIEVEWTLGMAIAWINGLLHGNPEGIPLGHIDGEFLAEYQKKQKLPAPPIPLPEPNLSSSGNHGSSRSQHVEHVEDDSSEEIIDVKGSTPTLDHSIGVYELLFNLVAAACIVGALIVIVPRVLKRLRRTVPVYSQVRMA